jgi:outer membrane protein
MTLISTMKKFRLIALAAALVAVTASAHAQAKIATVDMKKLFNNYYKTKMAMSALEKSKADATKDIKDMAENLDKAKAEYKQLLDQANDQAISADERDKRKLAAAEKLKDINNMQVALEQFQRQAQAQIADKSQRMSQNLLAAIQKTVADKAKAGGYVLVVNSTNPDAIVYSSSDTDITDSVLASLNEGAPIDVTQPSGSSLLNFGSSTNSESTKF